MNNFYLKIIYLIHISFAYVDVGKFTKHVEKYKNKIPYMDIEYTLDGVPAVKRLKFELFWEKVPMTSLNFAMLVEGYKKPDGSEMKFKGSIFHRIIKGFVMQGGDFINMNGTGGESVFGHEFKDENFLYKHNKPGMLSMANRGPNTNTCQFFITFAKLPHLDGKHVVFGRVLGDKGMDFVLNIIQNVKTNKSSDKPLFDVKIVDAGFESNKKDDL